MGRVDCLCALSLIARLLHAARNSIRRLLYRRAGRFSFSHRRMLRIGFRWGCGLLSRFLFLRCVAYLRRVDVIGIMPLLGDIVTTMPPIYRHRFMLFDCLARTYRRGSGVFPCAPARSVRFSRHSLPFQDDIL